MKVLVPILIVMVAAVHVFIARFRFLSGERGYVWRSFTGGIAIGYVFMHLLPDIADARIRYADFGGSQGLLGQYLFVVTLFGLVVYYGMDRAIEVSRIFRKGQPESRAGEVRIVLHASGYAFYNVLIGYLIGNLPRPGVEPVIMVSVIMMLHFLGLDYHFREMHQAFYDRWLRWVFPLSLFLGWAVGQVVSFSGYAKAVSFAFLTGAITINTIKEELPEDKKARFVPFLMGVLLLVMAALVLDRLFQKSG